jgi:hypothetical protein
MKTLAIGGVLRTPAALMPLTLCALLVACSTSETDEPIDPNFGAYIQGFTAGAISVHDVIVVELPADYNGPLDMDAALPEGIFTLTPAAEGEAYFRSPRSIVFQPAQALDPGTAYKGSLQLDKLFQVEQGYETFVFGFETIAQDFSVYTNGFEGTNPADLSSLRITGFVQTADRADANDLAKAFKVTQSDKPLEITFTAAAEQRFDFRIAGVKRSEAPGTVMISWDGSRIGAKTSGEESVEIPAFGDFKVLSAKINAGAQQSVVLQFSDPIAQQDMESVISIEDAENLSFVIDGYRVEVFLESPLGGSKLIQVNDGLLNSNGHGMRGSWSEALNFELEKPAVRMVGNKAIMPVSQGHIIPFEAVSLRAVDVYVTKIFSNNVFQYLQNNDLGTGQYLQQVGRDIHRHHIDLRAASGGNLHNWQRYYIDLSKFVSPDPGAFYKIEVRFKQAYAVNPCGDDAGSITANDAVLTPPFANSPSPGDFYYVDDYWSDYEYDWQNQEHPCSPAYYTPYRSRASQVFTATDLGLTAKMGGDKKLFIAVTDLGTVRPASGATVEVFDFQQQLIASAKTDADGFAMLPLSRPAFAVTASRGAHKTWLKVDESNALSLSKFQVQGAAVQDGLKGYIYGERGVWRPGDSLYLNFVLDDRHAILPKGHPVQFTLRDPRGQIVQQRSSNQGVNGFYDFRSSTDTEAPTGNYLAEVKVGNRSFSKRIKVETVKPNRLKINFDFGSELLTAATPIEANLEARWLHGASAGGLKAQVQMKVAATKTSFAKWPDYQFDNELEYQHGGSEEQVFDGKLGPEGAVRIKASTGESTAKAPGMMKLSFFTKVYEAGGDFSLDYHSVKYAPYASFTGIKVPKGSMWGGALETGQKHAAELIVVDPYGKKVNRDSLQITLYRLNRRWWYDRYNGNNFNFLNSQSYQKVKEDMVALADGRGLYNLGVEKEDWGRYLLIAQDPVSGHSTATFVYFDWPYWMRANRTDSEASTVLGFSSDKEKYAPGELIKLTFPSPDNGRALVCIENGTRILERFWVDTKAGETQVEIEVSDAMAPNVFANITLLQPHGQTANDRPMRMFGVVPILVENPKTRLEPVIETPEVMRPESKASITVRENKGRPMTYTLAVVDEGLLDLTRFKTPNPWDHFYAQEALGVRTWDMYDLVLGAFGQSIGSLLGIGGDDEAGDSNNQKAMRFKPMVRYLGPFELAAGKQATHQIDVPNYVGSVRVMVVAGQDGAWGNAEKAVSVRSPLMVIGTLPRVLSPGERVSLPANVFAMETHVKQVEVTVRSNELFKSGGKRTQTLQFEKPGDALALFELETMNKTGKGKVTIEARSGKEVSVYEVEIDVRSPNPAYTTTRDTVLEAGSSWQAAYKTFGISGTNKAVLELSSMPPINLEERLQYLIQYPHGCLEQTTSAAFPQLFLHQLVPLTTSRKAQIESNMKTTLNKLRNFQVGSGSFSYWPGEEYYNQWSSTYAGHFILEAEALGYSLPAGMKQGMVRGQRDLARRWQNTGERGYDYNQRNQAYRLYVLAKAGATELGAMNLLRERNDLDLSAKWMLALAYAEAGQPEAAQKLIDAAPTVIPEYASMDNTFGSDLRDDAFVLMTLQKTGRKGDAALVSRRIALALGSGSWYSTQSTAMALLALAMYHETAGHASQGIQADLKHAGSTSQLATGKTLYQQKLNAEGGAGSFELKNNTGQKLYARLFLTGQPITGSEERKSSGITMTTRYYNASGSGINPSNLAAGSSFTAEVSINSSGTYLYINEMALTQVFPSGWEIINMRLFDAAGQEESKFTYRDVRDDRVLTYFNIQRDRPMTFRVQLNATYAGRYYLPAILCNAMYNENIMATEPGKWVEVKALEE